ncbi:hypothetical protein LOTGIDRAFT_230554 [Lottia gigantea]|uniref:Mitochondria-eating protein n=1 Tax=Lottia gigantea TaxID=225164 RepID=V4B403_LOTGI|nr:hypothetical protein LOTGIDRAFT_230554 [Lottia gigantea]ESP02146.1 hypothetical protein LOTGIDRAFT_230554 [Lottia gigantea]
MSSNATKDLVTEAKNFSSSLENVFLLKKRDQQSKHLLEKAKALIDGLLVEATKSSTKKPAVPPRPSRTAGGMGQLWVKLDELKRENEDLRRSRGRSSDERSSPGKVQGPGDVIINDLHKTKTENDSLKAKVEKLQKEVKDLQHINATVQDEYKRHKVGFDTAQKSVERVRQDYKSLEVTLTNTKKENDTLKQKLTSSVKPIPRTDNRYTENISERCRPTNIAMRYDTLESQEWMDAKENLEDTTGMDEEAITKFLCDIIMRSYHASQDIYNYLETVIAELIRRPSLAKSICENISNGDIAALPDEMTDSLRISLRQICDDLDPFDFVENIKQSLPRDQRSLLSNKAVHRYISEASRVTWQMILQQPQMTLVADDPQYDDVKHKLWWACDKNSANKVDYYVWPVLYDYDHGNILVKGCVCTK